jgi:hypothetical protein
VDRPLGICSGEGIPGDVTTDASLSSVEGRLRGAGIVEWLAWQDARFGAGVSARALEYVPADLRVHFDGNKPHLGVDAERWYPATGFHALLDVVTREIAPSVLDALVDEAAHSTMRALMMRSRSVASIYSTVSSVGRYARVVNALFRYMHDTGRIQLFAPGPRVHEGVISEWTAHHPLVCRFTCMCQVAIYERMGCAGVRIEHHCISRGAPACKSVTTW